MYHLSFSWEIFEKTDDTKGVVRSRKSKDRQCNGHTKRDKTTKNNYLKNTAQKTNIETGRGMNSCDPGG